MGQLDRRLERLEKCLPRPACPECRGVRRDILLDPAAPGGAQEPAPCPGCGKTPFVIEVVRPEAVRAAEAAYVNALDVGDPNPLAAAERAYEEAL